MTVFNDFYWNEQQWVTISAYTNDDVTILSGGEMKLPLNNLSGTSATAEIRFVVNDTKHGSVDLMIGVGLMGRHSQGAMKITLYQEGTDADETV